MEGVGKFKLVVVHLLREGCLKSSSLGVADFLLFSLLSSGSGRCDWGSEPPSTHAGGQDYRSFHELLKNYAHIRSCIKTLFI